MENEVTLLALVIAQVYGGFAQPASSHVWKQSHYHTSTTLRGVLKKTPYPYTSFWLNGAGEWYCSIAIRCVLFFKEPEKNQV